MGGRIAAQRKMSCCIRDGCGMPYSLTEPETRDVSTLRAFWKRYCPKHRIRPETQMLVTGVVAADNDNSNAVVLEVL